MKTITHTIAVTFLLGVATFSFRLAFDIMAGF